MTEVAASLSESQLGCLSELLARRLGLNFPEDRWKDLSRSILAAAPELGFRDAGLCLEWLLSASLKTREIEILASHLTVGETYFFRDENLFKALEEHILLPLINSRREQGRFLRIWSAGCASGEEAYSLAMLLRKMIADPDNWDIDIAATDINPHFLKKARQGIYSEWSFRGTAAGIKERYFTRTPEGRWEIRPAIRKMVKFSHHNLAQDRYPPNIDNAGMMDVIVCRNVLMYFTPAQSNSVIARFHNHLEVDGWLIVSPWEYPAALFSEFKAVRFHETILYRKGIPEPAIPHGGPALTALTDMAAKGLNKSRPPAVRKKAAVPRVGKKVPLPSPKPAPPAVESETADLARHFANMGMTKEAREYCKKAIAADQFNANLHYLQATILQEEGRIEEAALTLKKVLYLDPDHVLAYFTLGNLTRTLGRNKEANKSLDNALLLLKKFEKEEVLPGAEGMAAGELAEIITLMRRKEE